MSASITIEPILRDLRAIYDLEKPMDRYWQYVNLMTKERHEVLPLGDFSPMGQRQQEYMDMLIDLDGEQLFAAEVAAGTFAQLDFNKPTRVITVVVDEPRNGWTHRHLTDFDYRFGGRHRYFPSEKHAQQAAFTWTPVYLWTTDNKMEPLTPTAATLRYELKLALFRTSLQEKSGPLPSIQAMVEQEQRAFLFARGQELHLPESTRNAIATVADRHDQPAAFAALYGDEAAAAVGYDGVGSNGVIPLMIPAPPQ